MKKVNTNGEYGPPDFLGERKELERDLHLCAELLAKHGEENWCSRINEVLSVREPMSKEADVRKIHSWFGKMGSFNDLVLCQCNGHRINEGSEEKRVNIKLRKLQMRISKSSGEILRSLGLS